MRRKSIEAEYPDIGSASYIIDLAFCFGFKTEWSELNSWHQLRGLSLHPFELKAINVISKVYHSAYREFDNTGEPRPFYDKTKPRDQESIRRALRK